MAVRRDRHHTGGMTATPTPQTWISYLPAATETLTATTNMVDVYRALAVAWHTSKAVGHPASVGTELRWIRLAEALHTAWAELATVADAPTPVPFKESGIHDQ